MNWKEEILTPYTENSKLSLDSVPDKSELEIALTPNDSDLFLCKDIIELSANAYQKFMKNNRNTRTPFLIIIYPKTDNDRVKRILKREKQGAFEE